MRIVENGSGVLVYMRQEGRIGLANKLHAYHLQEQGLDTVDANLRLCSQTDSNMDRRPKSCGIRREKHQDLDEQSKETGRAGRARIERDRQGTFGHPAIPFQ